MLIKILSLCLAILICYAIYTETGIFTAIGFFLILLTIEMASYSNKKYIKRDELLAHFDKLLKK